MDIGFKIDARPAEDLLTLAPLAESVGFDELWVCEDLGLAGGMAQVATALACTTALRVGLGILPAAVRNPAYLAMDLAALMRIHPGRFRPGLGHGMPAWLDQVGQLPSSLMACLREVAEVTGRLLDGETVTFHGTQVALEGVALTHPPDTVTPLSLGVRGPRGIALCQELGLGIILAEGSSPDLVGEVRAALGPHLPITVFVWGHLDPQGSSSANRMLTPIVADMLSNPALRHQLGVHYGSAVSEEHVQRLTVSGDEQECLSAIRALADAGADTVVLQPVHGLEEEQLRRFGHVVRESR